MSNFNKIAMIKICSLRLNTQCLFVCLFIHLFVVEASTTQPESSSEEEDERPSSHGVASDSSDSEDEQGTSLSFLQLEAFHCSLACVTDGVIHVKAKFERRSREK